MKILKLSSQHIQAYAPSSAIIIRMIGNAMESSMRGLSLVNILWWVFESTVVQRRSDGSDTLFSFVAVYLLRLFATSSDPSYTSYLCLPDVTYYGETV